MIDPYNLQRIIGGLIALKFFLGKEIDEDTLYKWQVELREKYGSPFDEEPRKKNSVQDIGGCKVIRLDDWRRGRLEL